MATMLVNFSHLAQARQRIEKRVRIIHVEHNKKNQEKKLWVQTNCARPSWSALALFYRQVP